MLICLRLLDKLVHLVVVLLFLLLLSLPLLSAALTVTFIETRNCITETPNCFTVTFIETRNCLTETLNCITVTPNRLLLTRPPILQSNPAFLFLLRRGELALPTVAPLLQWALHTKLLHLLAVTSTSKCRVRVGLAAKTVGDVFLSI